MNLNRHAWPDRLHGWGWGRCQSHTDRCHENKNPFHTSYVARNAETSRWDGKFFLDNLQSPGFRQGFFVPGLTAEVFCEDFFGLSARGA